MHMRNLFLWPTALLLGLAIFFSCAPPDDDDGPTTSSTPTVGNASTYSVKTGLLTIKGSNLGGVTLAQLRTVSVDGVSLAAYVADDTAKGADAKGVAAGKYRIKNDGTAVWVQLKPTHKTTLNAKAGMMMDGTKAGKLTTASGKHCLGSLEHG